MDKPKADESTVEAIVDLASNKCFDWAQGAIAETMAAVAARLAQDAVVLKHEFMEQEFEHDSTLRVTVKHETTAPIPSPGDPGRY